VFLSTLAVSITHVVLKGFGFDRLYRAIARCPTVGKGRAIDRRRIASVHAGIERACRRICRRSYCVQRAATLTVMLRLRGYDAVVVIGVRRPPFEAHAWTEVDGIPVGETREELAGYTVIHRSWPAAAWGAPARRDLPLSNL
jgi:hypothetical protein